MAAMQPAASMKRTPALAVAFARIDALEADYAAAVQRVLTGGTAISLELLVKPVDVARARTMQIGTAWTTGRASEAEVIEAIGALARLMEMVIGTSGRFRRH